MTSGDLPFGVDVWADAEALIGTPTFVLDVGSNVGQTVFALKQRWPACAVLCFEPAPQAYATLVANVAGLPDVFCRQEAVGSDLGTASMAADADEQSNTLRVDEHRGQELITVDVTTVDVCLDELGVTTLDVLKVDTEGFELEVLRGAEGALRDHRIELVLLECDFISRPGWPHGDFLALHEVLTGFGYRLVCFYCHGVDGDGWVWGDALWTKPRPQLPQMTSPAARLQTG